MVKGKWDGRDGMRVKKGAAGKGNKWDVERGHVCMLEGRLSANGSMQVGCVQGACFWGFRQIWFKGKRPVGPWW